MKYRIHMQSAIRDAWHVIEATDQMMANILGAAKYKIFRKTPEIKMNREEK